MPTVEIVISVLSAVAAMLGAGVLDALLGVLRKRRPSQQSYSDRLQELTANLHEASSEVDSVLSEIGQVARDREAAVSRLEGELKALEGKEKTLQQRIEHLQALPLPVAEYFAQLTRAGERRSARRDYMLFGAGVLVSTVISIAFFLIQGG